MIHRIRAAGLIVRDDRILLIRFRMTEAARECWIPPGGGLEPQDSGVLDTVRRELFEETGLTASVSRIAYINEWRQESTDIHHLEFFVPVDSFSGEPSLDHIHHDRVEAQSIKEVRWMTRPELNAPLVYPIWLRADWFWADAARNFPVTRYAGVEREQ